MKIVVTEKAHAYIREKGGRVWVWLDPRRGLVGSYVWLEAHCEPPGSSRRSNFTRSSKRPHRFEVLEADGIEVHYAFARLTPPDELHFDVKGRRRQRLEAFWNGVIFAGEDVELPEKWISPVKRRDG